MYWSAKHIFGKTIKILRQHTAMLSPNIVPVFSWGTTFKQHKYVLHNKVKKIHLWCAWFHQQKVRKSLPKITCEKERCLLSNHFITKSLAETIKNFNDSQTPPISTTDSHPTTDERQSANNKNERQSTCTNNNQHGHPRHTTISN